MKLTKYEYARTISARALQIAMGAPVLVNAKSSIPKEIARQEYEEKALPIIVKRPDN